MFAHAESSPYTPGVPVAIKSEVLAKALRVLGLYPPPPDFDLSRFPALRPGDLAIDCGANIGRVTEVLGRTGATVYAFEPNPQAFRVLARRFRRWKNVHCEPKGVWDEPGRLSLYLHEREQEDPVKWSTGSSLLKTKSNIDPGKCVEVELIDLTAFIQSLGRPVALIKMDIEGAECRVLNKLLDTGVVNRVAALFVETHDRKMPELKEETDCIRARIRQQGLRHIHLDWV